MARFAKFATICIKKCEKHPWRSAIFSKVAGTKIRWLRYLQEKNTFLHMIEMNHETVRRTGITCKKKIFQKNLLSSACLRYRAGFAINKIQKHPDRQLAKKIDSFFGFY